MTRNVINSRGRIGPSGLSDKFVYTLDPAVHTLLWVQFGQSNCEGVPTALTGAPPEPNDSVYDASGEADLRCSVVGTTGWYNKPFNIVDNAVHRDVRSNTINPTSEGAREWQRRINAGEDLCDLVMFNCSRSGTGFTVESAGAASRWNSGRIIGDGAGGTTETFFDYPVEGVDDQADVSLFHLAHDALKSVIRHIYGQGKIPVLMTCSLYGFESETVQEAGSLKYRNSLDTLHSMLCKATGVNNVPYTMTRIVMQGNPTYPDANIAIVNAVMDQFAADNRRSVVITPRSDPDEGFLGGGENEPIFNDGVHYTWIVQRNLAKDIVTHSLDNPQYKGIVCPMVF